MRPPLGEERGVAAVAVGDRYDPVIFLAKAHALRIAAADAPSALQEAYHATAAQYEVLVQRSLETTIISFAA